MTAANKASLLWVTMATAMLLGACYPNTQPEPNAVPRKEQRASAERVTGEYLVTVAPGSDAVAILEKFDDLGIRELKKISTDLFLVRFERDPGPEVVQERGRQIKAINYIEPNYIYRTQ